MKIVKIQVLRGPNIWSIRRRKLIQMRLDLEEAEQLPTNKIEGFRAVSYTHLDVYKRQAHNMTL